MRHAALLAGREEREKAFADLNRAIQLGPRDAANLRARGEFFADRHESEKALAEYAAALKLDPHNAKPTGRVRCCTWALPTPTSR